MSTPSELSFEEILKFMLAHNGKVTNHELVKHFKVFLTNPQMKEEARSTFKKHVNTLAIIKTQNNEKWLILKKKYMPGNMRDRDYGNDNQVLVSPTMCVPESSRPLPPYRPPPPVQLNQDFSVLASLMSGNQGYTSPIRSIPQSYSIESMNTTGIPQSYSIESMNTTGLPESYSIENISEQVPPKVHPRRKSSDSFNEKRSSFSSMHTPQRLSIPNEDTSHDETISPAPALTSSRSESMLIDNEQKISVKERKQMFNRMASESDVVKNKVNCNTSVDEEDTASLDQKSEIEPMDLKQKQWILCAARGEYHSLAKMCKENAKLVKTKDPFTGYTPLHIAMQFNHENVYRLLVEVYDADPNMRDWSGKKPRQYLVLSDTSLSPGSYRKSDNADSRRTLTAPPLIRFEHHTLPTHSKKESFLRIGSLNVRVKKTTEAFSNFLGVGATRSSQYLTKSRDDRRSTDSDQVHKTWGSADNIQKDDKLMPPPSGKVKRRGATGRKGLAASHSRSTPSTPDQPRAQMGGSDDGDSDSDSAAGFHAAWRQQRSSCA